jgi:hypothetical protein
MPHRRASIDAGEGTPVFSLMLTAYRCVSVNGVVIGHPVVTKTAAEPTIKRSQKHPASEMWINRFRNLNEAVYHGVTHIAPRQTWSLGNARRRPLLVAGATQERPRGVSGEVRPVLQPSGNGGAVDGRLTTRLSGRLSRVDAPGGSRAPG